jgi:hypothetical protein
VPVEVLEGRHLLPVEDLDELAGSVVEWLRGLLG